MQPVIRDVVGYADDMSCAAPRPVSELPLVAWRCSGTRRDGRPCRRILAEYATAAPLILKSRCTNCGHWNNFPPS
jgi:hypothetical protein